MSKKKVAGHKRVVKLVVDRGEGFQITLVATATAAEDCTWIRHEIPRRLAKAMHSMAIDLGYNPLEITVSVEQ